MPELKSKNWFPSTSFTTHPEPESATRGYHLTADGEMKSVSFPRSSLAFGPGGVTMILDLWVSTKFLHRNATANCENCKSLPFIYRKCDAIGRPTLEFLRRLQSQSIVLR